MTLKEILQGRFFNHPLHPLLVHLPVGLWLTSLIFDIVSLATGNPVFGNVMAQASWYCILIGCLGAVVAAGPGLAELVDIPRASPAFTLGISHMALNVLLLVGYIVQLFVRSRAAAAVGGGVFVFNIIETCVLLFSGYLGGRMAYHHGIGQRREVVEPTRLRRAA